MTRRVDYPALAREPLRNLQAIDRFVRASGLERELIEWVRLLVSQINRCAYCVDVHAQKLRAYGEPEQRLDLLLTWRQAPFYSERERAAFAWAEAVTQVGESLVPDEVFEEARRQFSEEELVLLTWTISSINVWNRLSTAFRDEVGTYRPRKREEARDQSWGKGSKEGPKVDGQPMTAITSTTEEQEIMH